jgi:hypothetical protein
MENLLLWIGRCAGLAGAALSLLAIAIRASGHFWILGVPAATLLLGAMALMLVACLAYLAVLAEPSAPPR